MLSRRKAWKAAYKAETGNTELRAAAGKVLHTALAAAVLNYWRCYRLLILPRRRETQPKLRTVKLPVWKLMH